MYETSRDRPEAPRAARISYSCNTLSGFSLLFCRPDKTHSLPHALAFFISPLLTTAQCSL